MSFLSTGEQPYSILRRLEVCGEPRSIGSNRHCNDRFTNNDKVWNRYAGCLVTKGQGTYRDWNDRVLEVGPGSFVHHFPNRYHHIEREAEGWEEFSVFMDLDLYTHFRGIGMVNEDRGVIAVGNSRGVVDCFRQLAKSMTRGVPGHAIMVQVTELFALVSELGGSAVVSQTISATIEGARRQLAEDFCAACDLEALARESGMSYAHFRRRFQREVGLAPAAYRNEQRLEQARALLTYQAITVSDVAARLGYSDAFMFSRQFRRRFGISPKPYHEAHFQT